METQIITPREIAVTIAIGHRTSRNISNFAYIILFPLSSLGERLPYDRGRDAGRLASVCKSRSLVQDRTHMLWFNFIFGLKFFKPV